MLNTLIRKILKLIVPPLTGTVVTLHRWWDVIRTYILLKLLVLTAVGLVVAYITWHKAPYTSKTILAAIVLCCMAGAVLGGYAESVITHRRVTHRTREAFEHPPLSLFLSNGFDNRFKDQLWGTVNNYVVIVHPAHGTYGTYMKIDIILKIPDSLNMEDPQITPYFTVVIDKFLLVATAELPDYLNKFNYYELEDIITRATEKLQLMGLEPYHPKE